MSITSKCPENQTLPLETQTFHFSFLFLASVKDYPYFWQSHFFFLKKIANKTEA